MARGTFYPVIPVCATTGVGVRRAARPGRQWLPAAARAPAPRCSPPSGRPADPLACDPSGPLVAEVVKTTSDPYVGRVSLVRVFSGTLRPRRPVHVSGHFASFFGATRGHDDHDEDERSARSPTRSARPAHRRLLVAGDIARISQADPRRTGDTLTDKENPRCWSRGRCPIRCCPSLSRPRPGPMRTSWAPSSADLQPRTPRADRTPSRDAAARALVHGRGACRRRARPAVEPVRRRRSTVDLGCPFARRSGRAKGHGRHVKQTGGHGQYAVCDLEVEPLPAGAGFEFADKVVGGSVPRQFIPAASRRVSARRCDVDSAAVTRWSTCA